MTKTSENRVPQRQQVPAHLARRFHQVCLGITAEVTERADLTPVEFAVIAALAEVPDTDQGSLAARLGIDAVSTHHLVHRLAAARASQERILAPLAPKERTLFLDMLTRLVEVHEAYARPGNGRRRVPDE